MADSRPYFDIHCASCKRYLFSGEWASRFRKGDEHLLEKKHYCKSCRGRKRNLKGIKNVRSKNNL